MVLPTVSLIAAASGIAPDEFSSLPGSLGDSDSQLDGYEVGRLGDGLSQAGTQPHLLLLTDPVWRISSPVPTRKGKSN